MDVHAKLKRILDDRGWSAYRLSKESGLSEKTIANIFKRGTMPSVPTLEAICNAFGITMAQFFAETEMVELTPELKEVFDNWVTMTIEQKNATLTMIRAFNQQ